MSGVEVEEAGYEIRSSEKVLQQKSQVSDKHGWFCRRGENGTNQTS